MNTHTINKKSVLIRENLSNLREQFQ